MIGRAEERRFIVDAIADPDRTGVLVAGRAGVGKTRLVYEVLATTADHHVESITASESVRPLPFGALAQLLPKRLAEQIATASFGEARLADLSDAKLRTLAAAVNDWRVTPDGTEGWRTAEVTLGGIDTTALSSQTMEAKSVSGLYFIGECIDVTGWLGGYNFQWAWSSGWAAGQVC